MSADTPKGGQRVSISEGQEEVMDYTHFPIEELGLSVRTTNALVEEKGIKTVGELLGLCGGKSYAAKQQVVDAIFAALKQLGLRN